MINNPYRSEVLTGKGKTVEVLYYYTNPQLPDYPIMDDELTPVIFEDEMLIGWGWPFLEDNISKYQLQPKPGTIQ